MTIISCSNLEEANNIASTVTVLNHGIACYTLPAIRGVDALKRSLNRAAPSITGALITGVHDEETLAELLEYDAKNRETNKENDLELIITTDIQFLLSKLKSWERPDTIKLITITDF